MRGVAHLLALFPFAARHAQEWDRGCPALSYPVLSCLSESSSVPGSEHTKKQETKESTAHPCSHSPGLLLFVITCFHFPDLLVLLFNSGSISQPPNPHFFYFFVSSTSFLLYSLSLFLSLSSLLSPLSFIHYRPHCQFFFLSSSLSLSSLCLSLFFFRSSSVPVTSFVYPLLNHSLHSPLSFQLPPNAHSHLPHWHHSLISTSTSSFTPSCSSP